MLIIDYSEAEVNEDGCLEVATLMANIKPSTVLVSIMMANNETGVIFPVRQIGRFAYLFTACEETVYYITK